MQFWRSQKNSQFDWFFLWSNSIFFTFPGLLPKQSYWTWSKEVPACKQMNLGWIYHGLIHFAVDRWIDKWSQLTHNAKYTVTRSHGTSVDTVSIHPFVMVRSMRPKSGNNWFSSYKYIDHDTHFHDNYQFSSMCFSFVFNVGFLLFRSRAMNGNYTIGECYLLIMLAFMQINSRPYIICISGAKFWFSSG